MTTPSPVADGSSAQNPLTPSVSSNVAAERDIAGAQSQLASAPVRPASPPPLLPEPSKPLESGVESGIPGQKLSSDQSAELLKRSLETSPDKSAATNNKVTRVETVRSADSPAVTKTVTPAAPNAAQTTTAKDIAINRIYGLVKNADNTFALSPTNRVASAKAVPATAVYFAADNDEVSLGQYYNLKRVATQYKSLHNKIRVSSYVQPPITVATPFDAMVTKRALTIAAYLVDLGVNSSNILIELKPVSQAADVTQITSVKGGSQYRADVLFEK